MSSFAGRADCQHKRDDENEGGEFHGGPGFVHSQSREHGVAIEWTARWERVFRKSDWIQSCIECEEKVRCGSRPPTKPPLSPLAAPSGEPTHSGSVQVEK